LELNMKLFTIAVIFLSLGLPSHAAPRSRRAPAARIVSSCTTTTTRTLDRAANSNLVITAFAVPVAVPVAPFAPYWYGITDFVHEPPTPSLRGSATNPQASTINLRCATCHGATSPKQGLSLIDPTALSADDRLRTIRAVVTGAMPPATESPLTDIDRTAILRELLNDNEQNENDK
jgi:hypothetical protein